MKTSLKFILTIYLCFLLLPGIALSQTDPLSSWNEGPVKTAIIDFINKITNTSSPAYIPAEDRIATFDNDGTLWPEQPVSQGLFALFQMNNMIAADPTLKEDPLFKAVLEKDKEYFAEDAERKIMELIGRTHAGMIEDEFEKDAQAFFSTAVYPKLEQPLTKCAYVPQVELLNYLRANGFKTYICSGGTIEFMRQISEEMYGIPPEQVIGTYFKYVFNDSNGASSIIREGTIASVNDKEGKPANIQLFIGKRPVFVSGNVRSSGDIAMMRFSQGSQYSNFQLLINHDDGEREFAYEEKDRYSLNSAEKYGFTVVSMKNDWKKVFSFDK